MPLAGQGVLWVTARQHSPPWDCKGCLLYPAYSRALVFFAGEGSGPQGCDFFTSGIPSSTHS